MLTLFITSCNYKPHKKVLKIDSHTTISMTDTVLQKLNKGQLTIILDENLVEFRTDSTIAYSPNKIVRGEQQNSYYCSEFTLHHLFDDDEVHVITHDEENIYKY